jgi:cytochrome c556
MTIRAFLAAMLACGLLAWLPAAAQFQRSAHAVKYRQSTFSVMGTHFGRIRAMVHNRVPFDTAALAANAEIVSTLSRLPFAAFGEGTDTGNTQALPAIWRQRAKFDAAAAQMQQAAAALNTAAKTGDMARIRPAFGAVDAACKGCHDDFRD